MEITLRPVEYFSAIGQLGKLHRQSLATSLQIHHFEQGCEREDLGDAVLALNKSLALLRAKFAVEIRLMERLHHPNRRGHWDDHVLIERGLEEQRVHWVAAKSMPTRECWHVFDSFLVHQATLDDIDFGCLRLLCAASRPPLRDERSTGIGESRSSVNPIIRNL